ncbi:MAG: hypothetical protein ACR2KW_00240 [Rubrobacter sp.]
MTELVEYVVLGLAGLFGGMLAGLGAAGCSSRLWCTGRAGG